MYQSHLIKALYDANVSTIKNAISDVKLPIVKSIDRIPFALVTPPVKLVTVNSVGNKSSSCFPSFFNIVEGRTLTTTLLSYKDLTNQPPFHVSFDIQGLDVVSCIPIRSFEHYLCWGFLIIPFFCLTSKDQHFRLFLYLSILV